MENCNRTINTAADTVRTKKVRCRLCEHTEYCRYAAPFLFAFILSAQYFVYSSDVSAQTNRRQTVNRERTLWIAQSQSAPTFDDIRRGMSDGFGNTSKKNSETLIIFFFLIAIVLFIGALVYYDTVYLKQRENLENPWVVFRELCKAHRLDRSDKSVLQRAADKLDLDDPLPLFIEPKFLISLLENKDFQGDRLAVLKLLYRFFDIEPPDRTSGIITSR